MERQFILQDGEYTVWKQKGIPQVVVDFLDEVRFGTEGAIYEHHNTAERVANIHRPHLVYVSKDDRIMAMIVLCNYTVFNAGQPFNSFYIRYFAASKLIRGKGITKHLSLLVMDRLRDLESGKVVFYAVLEEKNYRSVKIVESVGFRPISKVRSIGFSRFFPKKSKRLERITTEAGRAEVRSLLTDFYREHALVQFTSLFNKDNYYVIREKGEIVAGLQYHRVRWTINALPGWKGKILMNVLPYVPLLNRIANPRDFQFLSFEGFYFKPGFEGTIFELMQGTLAKEGLYSSMFWMSEDSPYYEPLLAGQKLGVFHQFVKDNNTYIAVSTQQLDPKEEDLLRNYPPYVSCFDFI